MKYKIKIDHAAIFQYITDFQTIPGHMSEDLREECGVFGVFGHPEAARLTYFGLYMLQHRGQESTGIVSGDGKNLHRHVGMGLVGEVFRDEGILKTLPGHLAIGHNRYSTAGGSHLANAQPLLAIINSGEISVAHNGNLVNYQQLKNDLQEQGAIFQSNSDSEVILHLAAHSEKKSIEDQLKYAFSQIKGAFSLVCCTREKLIAIRDPFGVRPLCLGKYKDAFVIASESCALDIIGAKYLRDVQPGEFIVVDDSGIHSEIIFKKEKTAHCIFEYVYFSRPDSKIFGDNVDKTRRKFGKQLAIEQPAEADIVISVPDSSNTTALGYSQRTDMKYEIGLIRNHYVGRTFISPAQAERDISVKVKFNVVEGVLKDRSVVVVDDSLVRGTTLKQLIKMIRAAGAKEVHVRIGSPPVISPCYYGMDFPTKQELIANNMSKDEICKFIEADSLEYLSLEGMLKVAPNGSQHYCTACFSGQYPITISTPQKTCTLPLLEV